MLTGKILGLIFAVVMTSMGDVIPSIHSDPPLSLRATLRKFSRTRHHVTNPRGKEKARKLIKKVFAKSGLHVWSEYIDSIPPLRGENIIGMRRGKYAGTAHDRMMIVGAHYDTTSQTRGVDDNGSGVTALLQVAQQIGKASCRFKNTILFVAFDFEEDTADSEHPIPFGSQWFVRNITRHLSLTGGTIKGAFILEMLANHNTSRGSQNFPRLFSYISPQTYKDVKLDGNRGNFLAVIGRKETDKMLMEPLKKHYENDTDFKMQLVPIPLSGRPSSSRYFSHLRDFYRSDHYNFWENSVSFPAVMLTDTSNFRGIMEKCYHRKCDSMRRIHRNDLEFLRRNINAVIRATFELSEADSCHLKNDDTLQEEFLTLTKTSALRSEKLKPDALTTGNAQTRVRKRNKIFLTSGSQDVSYRTLTVSLTTIYVVFLMR